MPAFFKDFTGWKPALQGVLQLTRIFHGVSARGIKKAWIQGARSEGDDGI
ncbi:MAG: hypothetical protein FWF15_08235 [Oscillospiraceae bacterium]|nr:hypothetical protein [Oscillospiraceae bacterium]